MPDSAAGNSPAPTIVASNPESPRDSDAPADEANDDDRLSAAADGGTVGFGGPGGDDTVVRSLRLGRGGGGGASPTASA